MIAKKIKKKADKTDSFSDLATYIAAARENGEKLRDLWIVECNAGETADDLDLAIIEVRATQSLNLGAYTTKNYHLTVNFAPGEQPDLEALKDMEREFAKALGFEDHQRVCGSHVNTDHMHFHVAYNRIHPETLKAHCPRNDYQALEKTCRKLETKYGLHVTRGMSDYRDYNPDTGRPIAGSEKIHPDPLPGPARDYEHATWEQSFHRYAMGHKEELAEEAKKAENWQALHALAADFNLEIRLRGNGLVFRNRDGKPHEAIKASAIHRSLSRGALEKRLGAFEPEIREHLHQPKPRSQYQPRPVTRHPGQRQAWNRYLGVGRGKLKRESVMGEAFRTWREFLYADALNDPLAMAIILAHKRMIHGLVDMATAPLKHKPAAFPATLEPVLTHWKGKTRWLEGQDTQSILDRAHDTRFGLLKDKEGNAILPLCDAKGTTHAVRLHAPGGRSKTIGPTDKLMAWVGPMPTESKNRTGDEKPLLVTRDFSLAAALHEKTGQSCVAALSEENISSILKELSKQHPDRSIILVDSTARKRSLGSSIQIQTPAQILKEPSPGKPKPRRRDKGISFQ